MVSFDGYAGPDLKFVNTQNTSIGLRASFDGKQLKLSIVGLPLLEENERISMRSEKIRELERRRLFTRKTRNWLMGKKR